MSFDGKIEELRARQTELVDENQSILGEAAAEKRELNADEKKQIKTNTGEFDELTEEIAQREKILEQADRLNASAGRKSDPEPVGGSDDDNDGDGDGGEPEPVKSGRPYARGRNGPTRSPAAGSVQVRPPGYGDRGRYGFRSFGEFAKVVFEANSSHGARFDSRLDNCIRAAATTFGQESVGEHGGFLVPPDFRTEIMEKVAGEQTLLSRTDQMTSESNSFTFPKDETTPWQTSGGVLAYWDTEAATINQSRPSLDQETVRLNRLTALVPVTEELLEDASAIDGYLRRKAPEKMNFKINLAIVQGTGAGQPLGLLNSPALVTVSKESAQTADTLVFENIRKMWGRLYSGCRQNAIWLVNQDAEAALMALQFPGSGTAVPVFLPPGGLRDSPFAMLLGRPVIPTEACETIGDVGDIILADLSKYLTVRKTQGVRVDTSMHLYFDTAHTAFRFIFRVGGQPWWASAIDRRDGSNTLSCAVTLAERS